MQVLITCILMSITSLGFIYQQYLASVPVFVFSSLIVYQGKSYNNRIFNRQNKCPKHLRKSSNDLLGNEPLYKIGVASKESTNTGQERQSRQHTGIGKGWRKALVCYYCQQSGSINSHFMVKTVAIHRFLS